MVGGGETDTGALSLSGSAVSQEEIVYFCLSEFIFTLLPCSHQTKVLFCLVRSTLRKAGKCVIPFRKMVTHRGWTRAIDEASGDELQLSAGHRSHKA